MDDRDLSYFLILSACHLLDAINGVIKQEVYLLLKKVLNRCYCLRKGKIILTLKKLTEGKPHNKT